MVLATLAVAIGPLCAGLGKGYSSPALASMAALSAQGQHFSISKDQGSWVASLSLLGAFFGSLPAGMSIRYGRKKVLCLVAVPFALSWVLTVVAKKLKPRFHPSWLRSGRDVSRELTTMKANIATFRRHEGIEPPSLAFRDLLRPLFVTCGLMVFQKFSGANAFNFYAVPILSETFVGLDPYRAAVVVAFVQICAGMASSALVDTVGRRPLLVFSNMLMSAALAAFGGYVYLKGLDTNENMFARQQWRHPGAGLYLTVRAGDQGSESTGDAGNTQRRLYLARGRSPSSKISPPSAYGPMARAAWAETLQGDFAVAEGERATESRHFIS
ncbi:hypothetical protein HAZT_HAZT006277 [Hyalella azteca]|uniref:Major facilitator superfamily (MFS) profile domain-containing protein n=1 Tax=Hyalella azteca TaxID=294128 RepID=A0A6A0HC65_HYAAZ|nr:hypothetical protein HAZT_HAZT006277 [Hyalella azteca]